ncbi:MAG: bleomycin resistance protein [Hyphomonadaceae bacterium]|nr:MAG: bleomycin resistance protein [Hyphomonadaceae bacterium]KAF0186224.1 MAG: bleomycin resistance protein [Hyphomonadaceae bacterium]
MHQTIPILLSRNLEATAQEYEKLGFSVDRKHVASGYLIANLDGIELHFSFCDNLDPTQNNSMCYIRTDEVDAIHKLWQFARIQGHGIPRLEKIEDKPWAMREFAFVDSNGNLIRVGKPI